MLHQPHPLTNFEVKIADFGSFTLNFLEVDISWTKFTKVVETLLQLVLFSVAAIKHLPVDQP